MVRLGELGAWVSYDFDPNNPGKKVIRPWLWNLGLLDYFHTANCVHFERPLASDDDLAIVQELPQLRAAFLEKSGVSDAALVHLRGLKRLTMLSLGGENATDEAIARLSELPQLEQLYVGVDCASRVTDAGLAPVAKLVHLKELWIENSPDITDAGMSQLEGLGLSVLSVRGTARDLRHRILGAEAAEVLGAVHATATFPV